MQFCVERLRRLQAAFETAARRTKEPYGLEVINYLDRHLSRFYFVCHECPCTILKTTATKSSRCLTGKETLQSETMTEAKPERPLVYFSPRTCIFLLTFS